MGVEEFRNALQRYHDALKGMESKQKDSNVDYTDFSSVKEHAHLQRYSVAYDQLLPYVDDVANQLEEDGSFRGMIQKLSVAHGKREIDIERNLLQDIASVLAEMPKKEVTKSLHYVIPNIPDEIRPELLADLAELEKCFDAMCYRSCVIICGRLLETALHRKYFEVTGQDILEKNPGIGLGKMVAKLSEKDIFTDPGLSQQIHLINNVRIFTVHKKKEAFYPTKDQTQATMLFTLDVVRKLFSR